MSEVVEATPLPTAGAAALTGEQGGWCGVPLPASGFMALFGALAVWSRRRRSSGVIVAAAFLGMGPGQAQAKSERVSRLPEARHASVEVRYGPAWMDDLALQAVFGDTKGQLAWVEWSPHIIDQLERYIAPGF